MALHEINISCNLCKEPQVYHVDYAGDVLDGELLEDARIIYNTIHWNEKHLNCAVCGKHISLPEMELAHNDNIVKIHKEYLDYCSEVYRGDEKWLHVHPACIDVVSAE